MTLSQTITYLWLNQALLALINQFTRDQELFNMIKEGTISYELARPKDLYFMWYFKILGQRLSSVTLRFFPLILVTSLLPAPYGLGLPVSLNSFIIFAISLTIGSLLVTALSVLYPIITITTMNEKGIVNIMITVADILSGIVVPIPFFPIFLQKISRLLPFQYISDLPFRIYVGNIPIKLCLLGVLIQTIWLILLIIIGHSLMKKNLKRVVVQGG
ncbi:MAG: ABC transporter permease [Bacilli bacterium]|nr:ABC transporter permease [Bacilli bacterium]